MNKTDKSSDNIQTSLLCEYAVMPFADCYCLSITGSSIPKIARYCMAENSGCPVYEKMTAIKVKQACQG